MTVPRDGVGGHAVCSFGGYCSIDGDELNDEQILSMFMDVEALSSLQGISVDGAGPSSASALAPGMVLGAAAGTASGATVCP